MAFGGSVGGGVTSWEGPDELRRNGVSLLISKLKHKDDLR